MSNLYQGDIDSVAQPEKQARADIEKIAQNRTLATDYKREQIAEIAEGAALRIEEKAAETIARLEAKRQRDAATARVSVVPSADDAARLAYGREVLREQWRGMNAPELFAAWQAALDAGDTLTARLYADFLPGKLRGMAGRSEGGALPRLYTELAARTRDALMTDDQRKAHQAAQDAAAAIAAIEQQARRWARGLRAIRLLESGALADADRLDYAREIRF